MYSAKVHEHFSHPRHVGALPQADAVGCAGIPNQGNFLVLSLQREGEQIAEARFQTYGCPAAIACGSWLCEWLTGRSLQQAQQLTAEDIVAGLDGLPLGKEHTASLAANALADALQQLPPTKPAGQPEHLNT